MSFITFKNFPPGTVSYLTTEARNLKQFFSSIFPIVNANLNEFGRQVTNNENKRTYETRKSQNLSNMTSKYGVASQYYIYIWKYSNIKVFEKTQSSQALIAIFSNFFYLSRLTFVVIKFPVTHDKTGAISSRIQPEIEKLLFF